MQPKIKEQKDLMTAALRRLDLIDTAEWLLAFDKPQQKLAVENMQNEYADIMAELLNNLISIPCLSTQNNT